VAQAIANANALRLALNAFMSVLFDENIKSAAQMQTAIKKNEILLTVIENVSISIVCKHIFRDANYQAFA
jgi:hypothetical protein